VFKEFIKLQPLWQILRQYILGRIISRLDVCGGFKLQGLPKRCIILNIKRGVSRKAEAQGACQLLLAGLLFRLLFDPENGDNTVLRNVNGLLATRRCVQEGEDKAVPVTGREGL
jgi:hypothetical protein